MPPRASVTAAFVLLTACASSDSTITHDQVPGNTAVARCVDFVGGKRIHAVDLARPRPLAQREADERTARKEFDYFVTDDRFEFTRFADPSDVRQLRVLLRPAGQALIGLMPAWPMPEDEPEGAGQPTWHRKLRDLGVVSGKPLGFPSKQDGVLLTTNVPGLLLATPPLETRDGYGYFDCNSPVGPVELWRASDTAALLAELGLVAWDELEQHARSGDLEWLASYQNTNALERARASAWRDAVEALLLEAIRVAAALPITPTEHASSAEIACARFTLALELLRDHLAEERWPAAAKTALRDLAQRSLRAIEPAATSARASGIAAEAQWLHDFTWSHGSSLRQLRQWSEPAAFDRLVVALLQVGPDEPGADAMSALRTFAIVRDLVSRMAPDGDQAAALRAVAQAHAERAQRQLVAATALRRMGSPAEQTALLVALTDQADAVRNLRDVVGQPAMEAVLEALLRPLPDADTNLDDGWKSLRAKLQLLQVMGHDLRSVPRAIANHLIASARSLAAALGEAAGDAHANSCVEEARWLHLLAADAVLLVGGRPEDETAAGTGTTTDSNDSSSDIAAVLAAATTCIRSGVDGKGVGSLPAEHFRLDDGSRETARNTKAFAFWSAEFAAARDRHARAAAARARAEFEQAFVTASSSGQLAHAARLLATDRTTGPPTTRSFVAAERDEQRNPIEALLLPVIARLYPFVDPHDPDRHRTHRAAAAVFALGRIERDGGLVPGQPAEVAAFGKLVAGQFVVPMLHALDNRVQLDYVADTRRFGREVQFTERNPALDGWEANVLALRDAVRTADDKIRRSVGIAPSDPGWNTWRSLQRHIPASVEELVGLRQQALDSLSFHRSFPPAATRTTKAIQDVDVGELRQQFGGHVAREVVVFADGKSAAEQVRHDLPKASYLRRPPSPFLPAVDEWIDPQDVSDRALAALDAATDQALQRLLQRVVAARAAQWLEEGRGKGWSDEQVRAEADALQWWFALPGSDPRALAALLDAGRDLAAVLDTQLGVGGWARRMQLWMPPVPPVEDLQEMRAFADRKLADGGFGIRFTSDLRHLVGRDPAAEPWAFDIVTGAMLGGDAAQALREGALGQEGSGDSVIWLEAAPDEHTFSHRWRNDFWASMGRRIGEFELRPACYRDDKGREHLTNQLQAFEVFLVGDMGADFERNKRSIVRVPTPKQFHDAGLLLRGQLAWTLSQARQQNCNRERCTHSGMHCWNFDGEPSIELWHLPSGDLLWQASDCRQLIVLAHLDRAISFHRDPQAPDDRRTVRIWWLGPPK